jgi:hypothetical protein
MDFIKALQSVEELLYEVALWIILIPKTLFRVFFTPHWIQKYVLEEWNKKGDDAQIDAANEGGTTKMFDGYMSPLYLFLIVGVTPLYAVFSANVCNVQNSHDPTCTLIFKQPVETVFVILGIYFLIGPLVFSLGTQLYRKAPVGLTSMRRIFYTQCYCFAPYYLLLSVCTKLYDIFAFRIMNSLQIPRLLQILSLFILPVVWFLLAELFTLSQELAISRLKAFGLSIAYGIGSVVLAFAIIAAYFTIYVYPTER